jgi:hypothetical protein
VKRNEPNASVLLPFAADARLIEAPLIGVLVSTSLIYPAIVPFCAIEWNDILNNIKQVDVIKRILLKLILLLIYATNMILVLFVSLKFLFLHTIN